MKTGGKLTNEDDVQAKTRKKRREMTKQSFAVKEQRQITMNNKLSQQVKNNSK